MDLTRILRRHQFSRGEAAALLASEPKVFEVTDLTIPAGTDWSMNLGSPLGTLELPSMGVWMNYAYMELAEAVTGPDALDFTGVQDPQNASATEWFGLSIPSGASPGPVARWFNGWAPIDAYANGGSVFPAPPTQVLHVGFATSGPLDADIHVVRARMLVLVA